MAVRGLPGAIPETGALLRWHRIIAISLSCAICHATEATMMPPKVCMVPMESFR
jgi:hypothetical protein